MGVPARTLRTADRDDPDVQRFLGRFFRFGADASVETYLPLFHPETALFDDGMERPIGIAEIPASITATLSLAQGFTMVPERWRSRDGAVFVEARNQATILGAPAEWRSVYRIHLRGDLVHRGRRFYDRGPLLAAIDPATPRLPEIALEPEPVAAPSCGDPGVSPADLVERCAKSWRDGNWESVAASFRDDAFYVTPGSAAPIARDSLAAWRRGFSRRLHGAVPELRAWAGDESLLFVEWEASVAAPGGTHVFGMVDRFDLVSGRVLAARSFFDAPALARVIAPV